MRLPQVLLYMVFLAPVSLTIADDGVSANYLFALLLFAPLGFRENREAAVFVAYMTICLLVGVALFSKLDPTFVLRQFVSYVLALFGVLLLFVRLAVRLEEFLLAIVLCAFLYSLCAIYIFATGGFSLSDIYLVKGGLRDFITDWPQRYVIVLVFAFFVALPRYTRGLAWQLASAVILGCIFLTFTRAAWLGVIAGAIVYFLLLATTRQGVHQPAARRPRIWLYLGLTALGGVLVYALSNEGIARAFDTMTSNFIDVVQTDPSDFSSHGSEGERLDLYSSILQTVEGNPLTGTGFAGAYLVIQGEGSAHSQYLDVLLRTGVIGLLFYLWFWGKLFLHYRRVDPGVTAGLLALFVFGFFHETTKLSYGSLIFFVLLNKAYGPQLSRNWLTRKSTVTQDPSCAA